MATLKYTTIQHDFRRENNLSCLEYVLLDMVFQLEVYKGSDVPGWCYMGREKIAEELGITKQGVLKMIDRMIEEGFLIKNPKSKFLQTTSKYNPVIDDGKQSLLYGGKQSLPAVQKVDIDGKQSLLEDGKQSLPNNIYIDNNNNNSNNVGSQAAPTVSDKKFDVVFHEKLGYNRCLVLAKSIAEYSVMYPDKYDNEMYKAFVRYWSEPEKGNKKRPRWFLEKTWDLGGRLRNWSDRNSKDFQKSPAIQKRDEVNPVVDPRYRIKKV